MIVNQEYLIEKAFKKRDKLLDTKPILDRYQQGMIYSVLWWKNRDFAIRYQIFELSTIYFVSISKFFINLSFIYH